MDIVLEALGQPGHERCARRDTVAVEMRLFGLLRRQVHPLLLQLPPDPAHRLDLLRGLLAGAEPSAPLLVHLGPRRHAVYRHVEQLARPHDGEQAVDALEDGDHHLVLVPGRGFVLGVRARVDDAVHVEIQIVKLDSIWILLSRVHGSSDTVHLLWLQYRKIVFEVTI